MTTPAAAGNAGTNGTQGGSANSGTPPASAPAAANPPASGSATPPANTPPTLAAALGADGQATPPASPPAVDYDKLEFQKPADWKGADSDIAFVRDLAKSTGLNAEQAQKLFDHHAKVIANEEETIRREIEQTRNDHIAELKSDPVFGGPKYAESITKADQFLAKYDPEGKLLGKLKEFGLEHQPDLVRVFMRAAAASSEGTFVQVGNKPPAESRAATAQEMYPSMPNA